MPAPALFPIITLIAKKGVEAAIKKYGKTAVKKAQDASKNQPTPKYMKDQKGPSIAEKEKAATAARKTRNRVIAGTGAVGGGLYTAHELAKSAGQSDAVKKRLGLPVNKANGGMLNSPAAVKRRSGAAVKGFKKGGMATKWESKWG
jgi:hypothetical protein